MINNSEFMDCKKCGSSNMLHDAATLDCHYMYCLDCGLTVNDRNYYECLFKWNKRQTDMRTIIVQIYPSVESWGTFKKCCIEKGWIYQTLFNDGMAPKVGKPVKIKDCELHRIFVK